MPDGFSPQSEGHSAFNSEAQTEKNEKSENYEVFLKVKEYVDKHTDEFDPIVVEERVSKLLEAIAIYNEIKNDFMCLKKNEQFPENFDMEQSLHKIDKMIENVLFIQSILKKNYDEKMQFIQDLNKLYPNNKYERDFRNILVNSVFTGVELREHVGEYLKKDLGNKKTGDLVMDIFHHLIRLIKDMSSNLYTLALTFGQLSDALNHQDEIISKDIEVHWSEWHHSPAYEVKYLHAVGFILSDYKDMSTGKKNNEKDVRIYEQIGMNRQQIFDELKEISSDHQPTEDDVKLVIRRHLPEIQKPWEVPFDKLEEAGVFSWFEEG